MSFYTFHQNNSGGVYSNPAKFVIIEASSAHEANGIAEENGLYFDGCESGIDCECCGDRWFRADELDAKDEPLIYGKKPNEYKHWNSDDSIDLFLIIPK